ncbi:21073_t:CDS:2 [Gigaspora margarita]|uniref:21073_t:CDS:1 n=1 Tax=Gigaspora margarita TaxID=4874 RepID=A0ABN7UV46_GIGMA|nr:21073_t:CDS:2 [Gigaspora margarita]
MTTQDEPDVLIEGVKDYNFFEDAPTRILNINPSTEEIPEKETTRIRDCINIPEYFYDTLYNANIVFAKMSNYPDIFKPFIVMFLSRELSVSENEMIDNFDFDHQSEKLYFWVDKTDTNLSRYNHISFDKKTFDFLKQISLKSDDQFKVLFFKDNYYIFILMLFVDFY